MAGKPSSRRAWKICALVTGILILTIAVVLLVLFLTVFKLKEPDIVARPINIQGYELVPLALQLNVTIGIAITVHNRNYGSFRHENSTSHISYRGKVVAEGPLPEGYIPARRTRNITTTLDIIASRLILDPHFLGDFNAGVLNFTSHTVVQGKGTMFHILKKKVNSYTDCNISIVLDPPIINSSCYTNMKLK